MVGDLEIAAEQCIRTLSSDTAAASIILQASVTQEMMSDSGVSRRERR